ncbi:MAG: hypothetical protein CMH44_02785 [Muricauda sp.]|nr:hypothetical protein [Allomuricauda sp.]
MRCTLLCIAGLLVGCGSSTEPSSKSDKSSSLALESDAEIMLRMYRSEGLQFTPAFNREKQSRAKFEGKGEESFWYAAANCLEVALVSGGADFRYVVAPSENSAVWHDTPTNWNDRDAVRCFQRQSRDDFYVSRVPGFSGQGGEVISPRDIL